ncbi:30S ribosomal protein S9 [Candidatus Woesearchaeota archaeon]|nr:30S ribosomal protein S9 [Candidatus Woesearchaeota archaeon]
MKIILTSGKRKRSIARVALREGKGRVWVNKMLLDMYPQELYRLKMQEPLIIAGDVSSKVDIDVNVHGGGISSQADASRLGIAKALVQYAKGEKLKEIFLNYDRTLLVADVRRKEVCKPNDSKARAKRQKSYR